MATTKPKATAKPASKAKTVAKPKTTVKTATKPVTKAPAKRVENTKTESCFKGFFAKKYEENESILTIFKKPKTYGALIGEIVGTMFISLLLLSALFINAPLSSTLSAYIFGVIAIYIAAHALSGAHLNPIITAGMMATRRVSVIRGVLYIIAQIIGAWIAWMIFNAYHLAGGDVAMTVPVLSEIPEGGFGVAAVVELLGALAIGFFFARARVYKRSAFTFAATVAGGIVLALFLGYIVTGAFIQTPANFVFNPATALMLQIFPTAGESFGEVFGGICSALAVFVIFPMVGGVLGAYLSELAGKLSGEKEA